MRDIRLIDAVQAAFDAGSGSARNLETALKASRGVAMALTLRLRDLGLVDDAGELLVPVDERRAVIQRILRHEPPLSESGAPEQSSENREEPRDVGAR